MQIADQLLRGGDLDGARAALIDSVKAHPADAGTRMFLFQLMCISGEWDKAKKQLETLAQLSPEARMLSVAYGQAIDAEAVRNDVFAGRATAAALAGGDWLGGVATSIQAFANGDTAAGEAARDAALDAAPDTPGELDGTRFEWIADADGRFGPCFEAIIGGRYGLVAFDAIEKLTSEGPRDLRDIIWYPVQIALRSGSSVAALLPARYPGSEAANDPNERLSRATSWQSAPSGDAGSGQHLWMLSNEEDHGLLSVRSLTFD